MAKNNGGRSFISVGVAILAVGLFLGWLATREPPPSTVVAEPGDTGAVAGDNTLIDESAARVLAESEMTHSARMDDLTGEVVRINNVPIAARLGDQMFWIELPSGDQYLVKLSNALVASGTQAPSSGRVNIVGRVEAKNEALLNQWMQSGALQTENQRIQAEFGLSYLEAHRVQPAGN
jgi:hypothetical protein